MIKDIIKRVLKEDIGKGDITTNALIPKNLKAKAIIIAKEAGVVCGLGVAAEVFKILDKKILVKTKVKEGAQVKKGKVLAKVSGPARSILTAERTALNFLQRLSGIATLTRKFVEKVQSPTSNVKILDTRKTTPGLRVLEKYAVKVGGGVNHRFGLYDAVLIKDNHIKIIGQGRALGGMRGLKREWEVETRTMREVEKAIGAGARRILLDNMNVKTLKQAVDLCRALGVKTEASGGVTLGNVRQIAATGVDFISVGALTHSPKALDISLKII